MMYKLKVKTTFYNKTLVTAHASTKEKTGDGKEIFYKQLEIVHEEADLNVI